VRTGLAAFAFVGLACTGDLFMAGGP
jgi:hypothetical protein